ncbi:MFS general substrate transporter [Atractiella rhizophila]|nr:MFS general substrate transporter [Atractiella rhizophila]
MSALLRESIIGQFIHAASKGRFLPYPEERRDFEIPSKFLQKRPLRASNNASIDTLVSEAPSRPQRVAVKKTLEIERNDTLVDETAGALSRTASKEKLPVSRTETLVGDLEKGKEEEKVAEEDVFLVGWYADDDQENPQNWSFRKKSVVTAAIMLLTFSVYIGSAIYSSSIPGVMEYFHVSQTKAILGLSLFVLGYGIGPMILSPLSEVPAIGRNPIYMATLFLFVILQIPAVTTSNYSVLMAMRFLTGFVGSPALATGGASLADIWAPMKMPYVIGLWSVGAVLGPVLGPVISGFAAMNAGWRWPLYELLMISGFALIVLSFILPETNAATILLKRAERLRKITGNNNLRSKSEIDQANTTTKDVLYEALVRPFQLALEPAVLFINVYIALAYSIFYLWFEAFPIVFGEIYGFNLGLQGLPFIGIAVGCFLAFAGYAAFQYYHVEPKFRRTGVLVPEERLQVALVASLFIPVSLLLFGWLSRPSVHWMGPIIAASLYIPGIFLLFQSCIVYLPMSYPLYAASLLAGNDLFRSSGGAAFPLFGHALFKTLGVGGGSSLLAGLSAIMIPILFFFYKKGAEIRKWSKYAQA